MIQLPELLSEGRKFTKSGAIAQLGERMTGSHEVRGSIPLGSTILFFRLGQVRISRE